MREVKILTTICPECDEAFRFIDAPLPITRACPHCMKKITIEKVLPHEEE